MSKTKITDLIIATVVMSLIICVGIYMEPVDDPIITTTEIEIVKVVIVNPTVTEIVNDTLTIDPVEIYDTLWYNETTLKNVREFMSYKPACQRKCACGGYARNITFEAHRHNLTLNLVTIIPVKQTSMYGGHRINYFDDNGIRYYTANFGGDDKRIVTVTELKEIMGWTNTSTKFINHKEVSPEWFEKNF